MNTDIATAIRIVKEGGIIIFPTDTAFGIGCRVDNEKAVEKLYSLRQRPSHQPASLLIDSITMGKAYVSDISDDVYKKLIEVYWPGALTIVLPAQTEKIPSLVRGGGETIGLRIPDHSLTLEIISGVGVPLLGPSANFHGKETPFSFDELDPEIMKKVDYVVDGMCKARAVSTVIDCTRTPWNIIRQGGVVIS